MRIGRISFSSSAAGTKSEKTKKNDSASIKSEKKTNTSKYIVGTLAGAGALAGLVIAGRRGCFGERIQNILGGVKKQKNSVPGTHLSISNDAEELANEVKIRQEVSDIIKDGKKTGVVIKDYKGDDLILTTTKALDGNGNVTAIDEKYAGVRKIEMRKITVNHNNHPYTVWKYFEIPDNGSSKSINFKFDDNNDYTFDLICVYPDEIPAIKQKLIDNGVKFGKCLINYEVK